MRLPGHPVHVMVVHFPVALWPTHWILHLAAPRLPEGAAASVGFWLLAAATGLGWIAAFTGLDDLVARFAQKNRGAARVVLWHAGINGAVLLGFTVLFGLEYATDGRPIRHGVAFLAVEAGLLAAMIAGNHLGGRVIWRGDRSM